MTTLIIAEKPSVAADIARALGGLSNRGDHWVGDKALVTSARGHLVQMGIAQSEDPGFNLAKLPAIPARFALARVPGAERPLSTIKQLAERPDVDVVVNACDAGREGELIFRLIILYLGIKKPVERMWFTTMTPTGIREAFAKRRSDAEMRPLADAARSRAEADFLIGVNATRGLTTAHVLGNDELINAGRVLTPTLALVVDREEKIRKFVKRSFWQVQATFQAERGQWQALYFDPKFRPDASDEAQQANRFFDREQAQAVLQACTGQDPSSVTDEATEVKRGAPNLFDLTSLQREANKLLGLSAKRTLDIAQLLYEKHKALSYPRTDSRFLPEDYPATVVATLGKLDEVYQAHAAQVVEQGWVTPKHRNFNNAKISDHFAIIPTGTAPGELDREAQAVYDMVVRRFIASFFPPAVFLKTVRVAEISGHPFKATGSVMRSQGWLAVYGTQAGVDEEDKGKELPQLLDQEQVRTAALELHAGKTEAPPRFTEASLLSAMENASGIVTDEELADAMKERGIGTPATRAGTIEELANDRTKTGAPKTPFIVRKKKELHPTEKAMDLIPKLRASGLTQLTSPELTGEWELRLRRIEKGQETRADFMADIRQETAKMVELIRVQAVDVPSARTQAARSSKEVAHKGASIQCHCGKGKIVESPKAYSCPACSWLVWKELSGRTTTLDDLQTLCEKGETELLSGFVSRNTQRPFSARLRVDGQGTAYAFERERA